MTGGNSGLRYDIGPAAGQLRTSAKKQDNLHAIQDGFHETTRKP
jgi:hypothetical protein